MYEFHYTGLAHTGVHWGLWWRCMRGEWKTNLCTYVSCSNSDIVSVIVSVSVTGGGGSGSSDGGGGSSSSRSSSGCSNSSSSSPDEPRGRVMVCVGNPGIQGMYSIAMCKSMVSKLWNLTLGWCVESPHIFISVLEVLSRGFGPSLPWALPYRDDMVLIGCISKLNSWEVGEVNGSASTWGRPSSWSSVLSLMTLRNRASLYLIDSGPYSSVLWPSTYLAVSQKLYSF